jgi:hypothetical protein
MKTSEMHPHIVVVHVCKMWEHGTSLEIVQWDAISKCGYLDQQNIRTHAKMKARAKSIIINIWVQPKGARVAKIYYFCEVIECMCQGSCVWRRHVCSWVDHWKWSSTFDALVGIAWLPCMQCGLDGICLTMNSRKFQMWYRWDPHDNGTHVQCRQDRKEL